MRRRERLSGGHPDVRLNALALPSFSGARMNGTGDGDGEDEPLTEGKEHVVVSGARGRLAHHGSAAELLQQVSERLARGCRVRG